MDPAKVRQHAIDLRSQVSPDLFTNIADPFPTTTIPALALAHSAYASGVQVGERASFLLRDALFERGLNIADTEVLDAMAGELGIDRFDASDQSSVTADWAEGSARGVKGSPQFFCGDDSIFCPLLDISRDPEQHLVIRENAHRLEQFLQRCLVTPARPLRDAVS
jgi:predicted DsbA family dithiol-disulfide isomerase